MPARTKAAAGRFALDGVGIKPGLALGSWSAFQKMGNQTEVMGDLVLTEDEVGPVMQKLGDSGIEITALHNHLIRESPTENCKPTIRFQTGRERPWTRR